MDFGKLQADIIKNIYKANLKGTVPDYEIYKVAIIDGHEYIPAVYKRISVILIPSNVYMLSFELAKAGNSGSTIEKLLDKVDSVEQLTDIKMIKLFGDKQLKEFRTKKDKPIFVDEKLLTPFGKDVRFFANESSEIVYIKDTSEYLGLVMATKIK
nr:MAG TPA: hypothetical protein [Caudoviricetes sp.]